MLTPSPEIVTPIFSHLLRRRDKNWILSYLKDRKSQVCIGVPQGSVVGPCRMFTYYTYPLGKIIQSHNLKYHIYADDTQIYIEFDPKIPGDTVIALHKLQEYVLKN